MSITKVAKLAGVSSSTVSRVINNHPRVAPETIESVRKAMEELSYAPSDRRPGPKPASRMATNVKFLVLGAARGSSTPGFSELLSGVSQAVSMHGMRLSFSHVPDDKAFAAELRTEPVHGLLLHGRAPELSAADLLRNLPTVWVMGNRTRPTWGDQVMPDSFAIGELAANLLLQRGHKKLAFLNLEACFWPFRLYQHAFEDTCRQADVACRSFVCDRAHVGTYWEPHDPAAVDQIVTGLLKESPRPTGIFVADDMQVAQIQPELQRRGVEIGPGKVEIVSCNNELPYLASLSPRPTSIDIRLAAIGHRAVEQLCWRLNHREVKERFNVLVHPQTP